MVGNSVSLPYEKERMTIQGKHLSQINTSAGLTIHFLKGDTLRKDIRALLQDFPLREYSLQSKRSGV